jgi:hypothetical protein
MQSLFYDFDHPLTQQQIAIVGFRNLCVSAEPGENLVQQQHSGIVVVGVVGKLGLLLVQCPGMLKQGHQVRPAGQMHPTVHQESIQFILIQGNLWRGLSLVKVPGDVKTQEVKLQILPPPSTD